jgi:hypothetical protein
MRWKEVVVALAVAQRRSSMLLLHSKEEEGWRDDIGVA